MAEELIEIRPGFELCHERFGEPEAPGLLLIMGLGMQMVGWHDDLCAELAARGFHVVRFDNRDTGRSTHLDFPPPGLGQLATRRFRREQYGLEDLAEDANDLIDALDLGPAHVVGASMGGMVAQVLAARRPASVLSLTSIMSNTGSRITGQPAFGLLRYLLRRAPRRREDFIEHSVELFRVIGSDDVEEEEIREIAARSYDRGTDPRGTGRQLGAILKTGNRGALLKRIEAPTLVIHGTGDRLVRPSGGRATAKAIPEARLMEIEGMGHDLPRREWPRIVDAIARHAAGAEDTPAAGSLGAAA